MSTAWPSPPRPAAAEGSGRGPAWEPAYGSAEASAPFAAFCAELAETLARPAERKRNLCRLAGALELLGDASVALCMAQPGGALVCEVGTGELAQLEGDLLPGEATLEGDALATGRAQETDNLRVDPRAYLGRQRGLPNTPALALPLELAGERIGVALFAARRGGEAFGEGRAEVLRQALALVAGALRNFAAHERSRASRAVLDAVRDAGTREADGMRRVVRAVRHELNTPASAVLGNLQLCASPDPAQWHLTPPELREAMRDAGARLEALSRLLHAWEESDAAVELDAEGRFIAPPAVRHRARADLRSPGGDPLAGG